MTDENVQMGLMQTLIKLKLATITDIANIISVILEKSVAESLARQSTDFDDYH